MHCQPKYYKTKLISLLVNEFVYLQLNLVHSHKISKQQSEWHLKYAKWLFDKALAIVACNDQIPNPVGLEPRSEFHATISLSSIFLNNFSKSTILLKLAQRFNNTLATEQSF